MIQGIKIINYQNDEEESLYIDMFDPSETGIYIKSIEGLGTPPASIETSKIVNYDPSEYENTAINPRNIVFTLGITNDYIVEKVRQRIYRYFVQGMPIKIVFITDVIGSVYIIGVTETVTPDIFSNMETVQASVICADPYFYTGGKIMVDSSDKTGLFNFTTWWEANVKNGELDGVEKPVSVMNATDENGNVPIFLSHKSRVRNPKGFEIEITQKENMFYKVVLEYDGGKMEIRSSQYASPDLEHLDSKNLDSNKNDFKNCSLIIRNDINDLNIYKKDLTTGALTSVINGLFLYGNFIEMKRNRLNILASIYGVYKGTYDNFMLYNDGNYRSRFYSDDDTARYPIMVWSIKQTEDERTNNDIYYQTVLLNFPIKTDIEVNNLVNKPAYKIIYKVYDENKKYIGRLKFVNKESTFTKFTPIWVSETIGGAPSAGGGYSNCQLWALQMLNENTPYTFGSKIVDSYIQQYGPIRVNDETTSYQNIYVPIPGFVYGSYSNGSTNFEVKEGIHQAPCFYIIKLTKNEGSNRKIVIPTTNGNPYFYYNATDVYGDPCYSDKVEFDKILLNNIKTVDDYIYIMYSTVTYLDSSYDPTDGSERKCYLSVSYDDLQIPEMEFLDLLYNNLTLTGSDYETSKLKRSNLTVEITSEFAVREQDNPDDYIGREVYKYTQTYDGKITLSYDDRYDAI